MARGKDPASEEAGYTNRVRALHAAAKRGPRIFHPAQAAQAASEGAFDTRGKKGVDVVEAARVGFGAHCFVHGQEPLPALPRRARSGIVQQIGFAGEAKKNGHDRMRRRVAIRYWKIGATLVIEIRRGAACCARLLPLRNSGGRAKGRPYKSERCVIFEDQLGQKQRIGEIGKRVRKTLRGVHCAQGVQIRRRVRANEHRRKMASS